MFKRIVLGAAVLATALVSDGSRADAFWGHSSGGSYGSGGSSGGSSGGYYGGWGSSGGSYGSYGGGSYGGGHHRHHHRRAYYGWGSSGGSYGSYGGSYYGGWGSSGGSYGSSGGSWGGVVPTGPVMQGAPTYGAPTYGTPDVSPPPPHPSDMPADGNLPPAPDGTMPPEDGAAPAPPTDSNTGLYRPSASATLTVRVPADAQVFVNGLPTTSTGTVRRYVSNGLRWGYNYTYHIRAEVVRDGQTITENKTIKVQAGDKSDVEFALNGSNSDPIANQPVRTSVTLHVPADAKVYLSGNETYGDGELRTFTTTKLAQGETWGNYVVRVEVERNGRTLSKEETIEVKGGDAIDLNVDLDALQVAQAGK